MDVLFQRLLRDYKQSPTDDLAHRIVGWVIRKEGSPKITHAVVDDIESRGDLWEYGTLVKYRKEDTIESLAVKSLEGSLDEQILAEARVAYLLTEEAAELFKNYKEVAPSIMRDSTITCQNFMFQQLAKALCVDTLEKRLVKR